MTVTSSSLLAKLENINWCYSVSTMLQGIDTNLLVKYLIEEDAYAVMLTDFSTTYFECLIGQEIENHYSRFNIKAKRLNYKEILGYLSELLQDLRASNSLTFEKLQVDCHTNRITVKVSKMFPTISRLNWNFYIISTDSDIFLKHFSMPMWRGLMHFYKLSKSGNSLDNSVEPESQDLSEEVTPQDQFFINDSLLKEVFR